MPTWLAKNVSPDCEPLPSYPVARHRALAIRQAFLDLGGRADVREVVAECRRRHLFDRVTSGSAFEFVRRALRPVATTNPYESIWGHW